jgi:hypothetical protein
MCGKILITLISAQRHAAFVDQSDAEVPEDRLRETPIGRPRRERKRPPVSNQSHCSEKI